MQVNLLREQFIFKGMTDEEIRTAANTLQAIEKSYRKDEVIFSAGSSTNQMGLVLAGSVTIESNDSWGNRTILSYAGKGEFFAETYALLENEPMLVDVVANGDCKILFLRIGDLRYPQKGVSLWKMKVAINLLYMSIQKNLQLSGRSFHISPKSIRGRIMAYLNTVSLQKNTAEFDIPFDRQQLADYLNVERTALSKELGKMQREGIIKAHKNHFTIIQH